MAREKLPAEAIEFFRKHGAKGGKKGGSAGGKKAAEQLTPEQRIARAKKASLAAATARKGKKRKRKQ